MNQACYRRQVCRLCDSKDIELALSLTPTPIADAYVPPERSNEAQDLYPLDLYLCRSCGHVQLVNVVDPDILFRDYTYVTSVSLGLVEHFRKAVEGMLQKYRPPKGSLVLEIGSNDGSMLKFFKEAGMKVLGVDPARDIARRATEGGIETWPLFFSSDVARRLREERGPAAIVTANNVFAHADNLTDICCGVRDALAPDGVFVFEVAYLIDLIDRDLFDTVYHEHLCYHSVKPFRQFFQRNGMELIDIEHIVSKGGSIRGAAQLAGGGRKVAAIVNEMIQMETARGFDRVEVYQRFGKKILDVKKELITLLEKLRGRGKTIAGFGASATCTTFLYHFGLMDKLSFIVDDNKVKHGMLTPGCHLPICPSQALYDRKPDYVVVLAWQYAEPIIAKNSAYLDDGGRFIVPFPKLRVVQR